MLLLLGSDVDHIDTLCCSNTSTIIYVYYMLCNVRDIVNKVLNLIKTVRDNEILKYVNGLTAVYVEKHPGNCCVFNAWLWLC